MIPRHSRNRDRRGYVYFAKAPDGRIKIGKARNPKQRVINVKTELQVDLEIIHLIATNDAFWLERKFHLFFSDRNVTSEWFNLSPKQIVAIKRMKRHDRLFLRASEAFRKDMDTLSGTSLNGLPDPSAAASLMGKKGGKSGGPARAAKLSPERRSEIARMGALARNAKRKDQPPPPPS